MYESKYNQYITKNATRFAEPEEIMKVSKKFTPKASDNPGGVPLIYDKNGNMYIDDEDIHTAVIGPSGCKKTRCVIYQTVKSVIAAGESAVITDPKGEIYRNTADDARNAEADIFVINLRTMKCHQWNPLYQAIKYYNEGNEDFAFQLINDFVQVVIEPSINQNDRFWADMAASLFNANTLSLLYSVTAHPEYFNIGNIIQMSFDKNTDTLRQIRRKMDPMSTAALGYNAVLDNPDKTRACIYSSLSSALEPFMKNRKLIDMLSGNSFLIEDIGKKQTIIYLIYPDEKRTLNFIINLFLTQCYEILVNLASQYEDDRLPVRCNFILDEFSNLPKIDSFENRISECRSKNMRYILSFQALSQLKNKYGDCADTILSNCNNWIVFSSKETELLRKVSELCGNEVDYNGIEHPLLNPFEMQHLKKEWEYAEAVIIKQGEYPFVTKLRDIAHIPGINTRASSLHSLETECNARFISFEEWIRLINNNYFRFPFPKNS